MNPKKTHSEIQASILEQATYQNGYSAFIPSSKSIGFKVHSIKFQDHAASIRLAEDFLTNLGFCNNDLESEYSVLSFLLPAGTVMLSLNNQEDNNHIKKIPLPKSAPLKMAFDDVIKSRRSIRHYTGDKVPLTYLATVLRISQGISSTSNVDLQNGATTNISFRTIASAGGIYPIDIYVAALNVDGLEKAIYQFNPLEESLIKLYDNTIVDQFLTTFATTEKQISLKQAGFICLLVGTASKSMHKYGNLGLAFTLHEAGSISQNIHLAITALGLGSVDCASYLSNEAHKTLKLDGVYKHLFHTIIVGTSQ